MSKSMLMGMVAGIGVATAGGVLGYQFLGERPAEDAAPKTRSWPRRRQPLGPPRPRPRSAGTRKST